MNMGMRAIRFRRTTAITTTAECNGSRGQNRRPIWPRETTRFGRRANASPAETCAKSFHSTGLCETCNDVFKLFAARQVADGLLHRNRPLQRTKHVLDDMALGHFAAELRELVHYRDVRRVGRQ